MNYKETKEWLFNQLPVYQLQGASAYKEDLTNTILLMIHLNHPENKIKCIHVAGTNGKGSTSHLLASVLQEAGYKVGLYTSPHLKDFRERIKVNGLEISEDFVCKFVSKNKSFFDTNELSFFEMTVGLAFEYFVKEKTDINIIEVGMGGRLDSTNVITPLVSIITNIGLDHTQFLGNTLSCIAQEKAGIIKQNIPVVIGEFTTETKEVFSAKATDTNSEIYFASDLIKKTFPSVLLGDYQLSNKKTVQQTVAVLQNQKEFKISEQDIKNGFSNVVKNTGLQGRWQQINENPKAICDTAHNAYGLKIFLHQVQK
jgi:dihydrofolate synthase/folylpolyglutamate synthase